MRSSITKALKSRKFSCKTIQPPKWWRSTSSGYPGETEGLAYVYALFHPVTGDVVYIGKGSGDRMRHHARYGTDHANEYLAPLFADFGDLPVFILIDMLDDYAAYETEHIIIQFWGIQCDGTGKLLNRDYGGTGGSRWSESSKLKRKSTLRKRYGDDFAERFAAVAVETMHKKFGEDWGKRLSQQGHKALRDNYGENYQDITAARGRETLREKQGENWGQVNIDRCNEALREKYGDGWRDVIIGMAKDALREKYGPDWAVELASVARQGLAAKYGEDWGAQNAARCKEAKIEQAATRWNMSVDEYRATLSLEDCLTPKERETRLKLLREYRAAERSGLSLQDWRSRRDAKAAQSAKKSAQRAVELAIPPEVRKALTCAKKSISVSYQRGVFTSPKLDYWRQKIGAEKFDELAAPHVAKYRHMK